MVEEKEFLKKETRNNNTTLIVSNILLISQDQEIKKYSYNILKLHANIYMSLQLILLSGYGFESVLVEAMN